MTDYYLKFESENVANAVLYKVVSVPRKKEIVLTQYLIQGERDNNGVVENIITSEPKEGSVILDSWPTTIEVDDLNNTIDIISPNYRNIDVLGILYQNQEISDPENPPEPIQIDGWHVNIRTLPEEDDNTLEEYRIDPEPQLWRRVWG